MPDRLGGGDGRNHRGRYKHPGISVDLPAIESQSGNQNCDRTTGAGCTHIPVTDDGAPAAFYPFYSITHSSLGCVWQMGNEVGAFG
jgi:hypothetical protein